MIASFRLSFFFKTSNLTDKSSDAACVFSSDVDVSARMLKSNCRDTWLVRELFVRDSEKMIQ